MSKPPKINKKTLRKMEEQSKKVDIPFLVVLKNKIFFC
jgi:hypothetical protein